MDELFLKIFNFVLEISYGLDEELISIIEDDQHLFAPDFVEVISIVRIAEFGDLVEFVPEHISVPDVVEVDEEIDLVYSSLDQIGGCLYGEGGLPHPWIAVEEEEVKVRLSDLLHELVELLLTAHY
jgi:hypothetical protein